MASCRDDYRTGIIVSHSPDVAAVSVEIQYDGAAQ